MKYLILFLLLLPVVSAVTETKEDLGINSTTAVYGKTLTILGVDSFGQIKVAVDGVKGILREGRTDTVNDMRIKVTKLTVVDDYTNIDLEITVEYECGNDVCEETETKLSCCTDCGCTKGDCFNNICREAECTADLGCYDAAPCTMDRCNDGICENTIITNCESGDKCCPEGCDYSMDKDCLVIEGFCVTNEECNDNNPCSTDECIDDICRVTFSEGCALDTICRSVGEVVDGRFCSKEGWLSQKPIREGCTYSYECSEGECIDNICKKRFDKNLIVWLIIGALATFIIAFALQKSLYRKKTF